LTILSSTGKETVVHRDLSVGNLDGNHLGLLVEGVANGGSVEDRVILDSGSDIVVLLSVSTNMLIEENAVNGDTSSGGSGNNLTSSSLEDSEKIDTERASNCVRARIVSSGGNTPLAHLDDERRGLALLSEVVGDNSVLNLVGIVSDSGDLISQIAEVLEDISSLLLVDEVVVNITQVVVLTLRIPVVELALPL